MARLSAGGFFKNFVKGAAQQYNANVAYLEQQKVEEERQKKKEERQFGFQKRLKEMELTTSVELEKAKSENKKKFLGQYEYKNPNLGKFNIFMPDGYASLPDVKSKYTTATGIYAEQIKNLPKLKRELTDQGYQNLLSDIIMNYAGMSTVKDGKVEGQDVEVVYNPIYYKAILSNPDLANVLAQQIQKDKTYLEEYIKGTNPNAFLDSKAQIKESNGMVTMSIPGFYGADERGLFKKEDIMIAQRSILRTGSNKEVIDWMRNQQKFMEEQKIQHQQRFGSGGPAYTGSDLIKAIGIAKKAIDSRLEPSQISNLTPEVGQTIRNALREEMPELGETLVNDPEIFHRIIKNSLPRKANPPLRQVNNQQVASNKEAFLTRVFGPDKGKMIINSLSKAQQSGQRFTRANEVISLVDAGAGTGYAARIQSGATGFYEQAKSLLKRMTGYKGGNNEFGQTAEELSNTINNLSNDIANAPDTVTAEQASRGIKTKDQIANDALLKYTTTLMVFDIATMAQDAGGGLTAGGTTVRLSDGDVRLSAQALQQSLNENPQALKIVAMQVAELAEKEKVIFEMIARGDVADAGAALVMLDAYRGELGAIISAIKDQNDRGRSLIGDTEGVNKQEGYTFKKEKSQNIDPTGNDVNTTLNQQPNQQSNKKVRKSY